MGGQLFLFEEYLFGFGIGLCRGEGGGEGFEVLFHLVHIGSFIGHFGESHNYLQRN